MLGMDFCPSLSLVTCLLTGPEREAGRCSGIIAASCPRHRFSSDQQAPNGDGDPRVLCTDQKASYFAVGSVVKSRNRDAKVAGFNAADYPTTRKCNQVEGKRAKSGTAGRRCQYWRSGELRINLGYRLTPLAGLLNQDNREAP